MPGVDDRRGKYKLMVKNDKKYQFSVNIPVQYAKELDLMMGTTFNCEIIDGKLVTSFIKPEKAIEKLSNDEIEFVEMFLRLPKKIQKIDCKLDEMCSIYNKLADRDAADMNDMEKQFVETINDLRKET